MICNVFCLISEKYCYQLTLEQELIKLKKIFDICLKIGGLDFNFPRMKIFETFLA